MLPTEDDHGHRTDRQSTSHHGILPGLDLPLGSDRLRLIDDVRRDGKRRGLKSLIPKDLRPIEGV
jgi:hypothetical protein